MNKEIEDALHTLLHCSLKDTEYETQFEQYKIVRDYIINLQQENKQLKNIIKELEEWLNHKHNDYKVLYKMYGNPYFMVEEYEKILKQIQELKEKYK